MPDVGICAQGMVPVSSGTASIFGLDLIRDLDQIRHMVGYCPQHSALFPSLTVVQHLELFAAIRNMEPGQIPAMVDRMVAELGLTEKRGTAIKDLSGGMQRKVSIAIAMLGNTKVRSRHLGLYRQPSWSVTLVVLPYR
jgi:ABC-type multidrug transport system ATPase subunit